MGSGNNMPLTYSTHCIILIKVTKLSTPAFFHLELEIPIPILSAFDGH